MSTYVPLVVGNHNNSLTTTNGNGLVEKQATYKEGQMVLI